MLKRRMLSGIVGIIFVLGLIGCGSGQDTAGSTEDVVAIVNDQDITKAEFDASYEQYKLTYAQQGMNIDDMEEDQVKQIEQKVVDQLVNSRLLLQAAEKNNIEAAEEEVQQSLEQIKGQFDKEEEFTAALEANKLTLAQLEKQITDELKVNQYISENITEVTVEEEEIKAMYDQYKEQSEKIPSFEEVKAQLKQQIAQQKNQVEVGKLVEKLRNESEIEVLI
ncbi:SurA N-terminal domain-containing protein [Cytobacillus sp. S13-E01]|uniref:SurA N-terminal domain-containing protein n=1 Tax=Cytobacillus sp. S13-E01 TaxID=3031326 RepID=UPI0023D8C6B0|nr:SurA N-terminal domain-containing protein [Cytobacillus sp. S13-E01]MDF0728770.1 SurA N-terminal domain-containing protein [Cytobacillus sp. S13-E01]